MIRLSTLRPLSISIRVSLSSQRRRCSSRAATKTAIPASAAWRTGVDTTIWPPAWRASAESSTTPERSARAASSRAGRRRSRDRARRTARLETSSRTGRCRTGTSSMPCARVSAARIWSKAPLTVPWTGTALPSRSSVAWAPTTTERPSIRCRSSAPVSRSAAEYCGMLSGSSAKLTWKFVSAGPKRPERMEAAAGTVCSAIVCPQG